METISALLRHKTPKAKSLRKQGLVPGVLYGPGFESLPIALPLKEFKRLFTKVGESSLLNLVLENKEKNQHTVLIREIQRHPLTSSILHVDFYKVPMHQKIKIKIPLEFVGEAPAEAEQGATILKNIHELEIEALPKDLPHKISIDLSNLTQIGSEILVKDLVLPPGVSSEIDPETVVAQALAPISEEELEALEKPVEEMVAEVEEVAKKEEQLPEEQPAEKEV